MPDLQQTTGVDVGAVPEITVAESQAPAGAAGSPLPAVGTNQVNQWALWDPNQWWTDWNLPPDPRPSWERWFDWANQLKALTPALGQASQDWQTMIGQLEDSLQTARNMRAELASWTGPSAVTMSESLDRLENAITTKVDAVRENPARLESLARTIDDAVAPMAALDTEYQQVLGDLAACRVVAERGRPIMLNVATKLLQTGTDLENSVLTDVLAPQPVPPQPLTLTDGPQGPSQQLTQVAAPSNLADPGNVGPGAPVAVAPQPSPAGPSILPDPGGAAAAPPQGGVAAQPTPGDTYPADPGPVPAAQQDAVAQVPGVAVGPTDGSAAGQALPTQPGAPVVAAPTLAGTGGGAGAVAGPVGSAPATAAATPATLVAGSPVSPSPAVLAPQIASLSAPSMTAPADGRAAAVATPVVPVAGVTTPAARVAPTPPRSSTSSTPSTPDISSTSDTPNNPAPARPNGVPLLAVPAVPLAPGGVSGSVAVPTGLRGRTRRRERPGTWITGVPGPGRRTPQTAPLDAEAFEARDAGTGLVAPRDQK